MPRIAPFRKMFSRPVSSGWNPVPDLEQRSDAAADRRLARGRLGDAREDLQQRALARPVAADDARRPRPAGSRRRRRAAPRTWHPSPRAAARRRRPRAGARPIGGAGQWLSRSAPVPLAAGRAGTLGQARRAANRRCRHDSDDVGERPLHAPEVEQPADQQRRRRTAADTSDGHAGWPRAPEQRPAEALDDADHRVEPVERPPRLRHDATPGRRPAWRTSRSGSRNGSV